jgi:dTDP-glucose pyrophosphorylase
MGSDTIVKSNMNREIEHKIPICQGIISVADMPGDRWSFALTDQQGKVLRVAEKQRISTYAGTGMYHFTNGRHFVRHSEQMIRDKATTKGEYYIMPVYQRMIENGEYITISKATAMWDLGTPDALNKYLNRI